MHRIVCVLTVLAIAAAGWSQREAEGAGSPYSTLVVANRRSHASLQIAAYYARKRGLPAANVVFVDIEPSVQATEERFQNAVVAPVWARIDKLGDRITHVALTQGIPYRVSGFSAATILAFGGREKLQTLNPFYNLPMGISPHVRYLGARMVLVTMLAAPNVDEALKLIDRSVAADFARPIGTLYLCDGAGPRGVRKGQYKEVVERYRRIGVRTEYVRGSKIVGKTDVIGWMTGDTWLPVEKNRYMPGAIVDNLTSFGGRLYEESGQMSVLSCISAGASATHGTVVEPTNYILRWPNAMLFLYYMSGFTLAESYWHTIASPLLGVVVGDPLMQTWASRPQIDAGLVKPVMKDGQLTFEGEIRATGNETFTSVALLREGRLTTLAEVGPTPGSELLLEFSEPQQDSKLAAEVRRLCPFDKLALTVEVKKGDTIAAVIKRLAEKAAENKFLSDPSGVAVEATPDQIVIYGRKPDGWGSFLAWRCGFVSPKANTARVLFNRGYLFSRGVQPAMAPVSLPAEAPVEGDRLVLTIRKLDIPAVAGKGDSLKSMVERIGEMYGRVVEADMYKDLREIKFKYVETGHAKFMVFVHPPRGGDTSFGAIRVSTVPGGAGSKWKKRVLHASFPRPGWPAAPGFIPLPIGGMLRTARVRHVSELKDWPRGYSRYQILVTGGTASATTACFGGEVFVPGGPDMALTFPGGSTASAGAPLNVKVGLSSVPRNATVLLVVDGRPVGIVAAGGGTNPLDPAKMDIAPGEHELTAEVIEGKRPTVPSVLEARKVLARSRPVVFSVRPVLTATFSPHGIEGGKPAKLEFRGDYLREGIPVRVGAQTTKLVRDTRYPFIHYASFQVLEPGRHDVTVGEAGATFRLNHAFVEVAATRAGVK